MAGDCRKCDGFFYYRNQYGDVKECFCVADAAENPTHYAKGGLECRQVVAAVVSNCSGYEGHLLGSAIEYIWRWKNKNGIQDIFKARQCLEMLVEYHRLEISDNENLRTIEEDNDEAFGENDKTENGAPDFPVNHRTRDTGGDPPVTN